MKRQDIIYLDNNSTTPVDPRVLESMWPILKEWYGNPASTHNFGHAINKFIKQSRSNVAKLLNCSSSDIIFTSGATESINLALKGYALANQSKGNHIVTLKTEHKAVLDTCEYLESIGFDVTYLDVKEDGLLSVNDLQRALRPETLLVSIMLANNETGVIQPMSEIADVVHRHGSLLFCDATQAVGKTYVDVRSLSVDMLAFSGHKFYAPKGVGGLFVRDLKRKRIKLQPILHGGGHEDGLRSGTLNVPGIFGLGVACDLAFEEIHADVQRIKDLRDRLENELLTIQGAFVNGSISSRMYNVTNICFPSHDADHLIGRMPNISVSNGSACTASLIEPSHVLLAMGLTREDAMASIRFSLGRFNTAEELPHVITSIKRLIEGEVA
ncbi:cysteine desulfurase family protein [Chryseolinea soli]|uniref:cysteine desulfurase n=1 Tax=Chryseolinea soli TaxID=2321403 RepID=A0A385SNA3_9BACT|nr:cysteine desulfurase family protein [Chryseolinea soli]AYB31986.1 cysteine desulfurase [Chryseolinea soli]